MGVESEDLIKKIEAFKTELAKKQAELEKAWAQEKELKDTSRAMLNLLDDLNKSSANMEAAKKDWETTFDAMLDPVFIHDSRFRVVRANRAYQEAAGLAFHDIIGMPYYEVFPKTQSGPCKGCLKAIEPGIEEKEEIYIPQTGKTFKMLFYAMKDAAGKQLCGLHVMENITDVKKAEDAMRRELEIIRHLLMISNAAARTTDIDRLMEQVVSCLNTIMSSDIALSYLWDGEGGAFLPSHATGLSHEQTSLFLTEHIGGNDAVVKKAFNGHAAIIGKETLTAEGPGTDALKRLFSRETRLESLAVIPLYGRLGPLGLLICAYTGLNPKGAEALERMPEELMNGIGSQVSTALDEARVYRESTNKSMELSHKIETIKIMHEIDKHVLSTLEPQEILDTAVLMISKIIPCDRVTVVLVDRARGGFSLIAGFGTKNRFAPFEDTNASEILKTGRLQYAADLREIGDIKPLEKSLLDEGFISHIRMPLTVKGEISGILTVGSRHASAYTPEDLSTMEKLASQISVALENARLVKDLEELFIGIVRTLSKVIDTKSPWTQGHSERVTEYALEIGRAMGMGKTQLKRLELAGLLHDIGKIGTYEAILDKPGRLSDEELEIMKRHPSAGAEILQPIKQLADVVSVIKCHHEFYDGSGYPDGIKGESIPLMARMLTVADAVDAMSADRPYRKGKPASAIMQELKRCSGTQFDPAVAKTFLSIIEAKWQGAAPPQGAEPPQGA
ncbi:MAG: HD domain-containing protein [Deltaproteobacteria bacterium]|nr:HD domain-containing protein [Deltaproteobacteria bacterium]